LPKFIESIGLSDVLAFICPGTVFIVSLSVWLDLNLEALLGKDLAANEYAVAVVFVAGAFASGMIFVSFASEGADSYQRRSLSKRDSLVAGFVHVCLKLFCSVPGPRMNQSLVAGQVQIALDLERHGKLRGLSVLESPWDRLTTYRTVMEGKMGEKAPKVFHEAGVVHQRLLFALGVAFALLILGLHFLARALFWWNASLPHIEVPLLIAAGSLAIAASLCLRWVGGKWWEKELLLTVSLTGL
jgi:hypothetical protein